MAVLSQTFSARRAVLVSGGIDSFQNHARYLNDLTAFYSCLVGSRYKFDTADIQVLYANGGLYDMAGHSITTQVANHRNVVDAIELAILGDASKGVAALDDNGLFILMTTNHGDSSVIPHRLLLWTAKEFLDAADLGAAVGVGKSANHYSLGIFGQCFGADCFNEFLINTPANRSVVLAASSGASYALGPDYAYDAFLYHLTAALIQMTPSGYPADSDAKSDGQIDIQEAFDFAKRMDATQDKPDLDGDKMLAAKMTLEGLI